MVFRKKAPDAGEKARIISALRKGHNLNDLLQAADLPRSTFYYHQNGQKITKKYAEVTDLITTIFKEHEKRYGYRRITLVIRSMGHLLNHKTVRRLMCELGLKSPVRRKKYRSYKGTIGEIADNLLAQNFSATAPCEKWVTDVTEFSVADGKLYLSPILDLFNGEIVAWATARKAQTEMINKMLKKAFKRLPGQKSVLLHSDQGWHYQMKTYQDKLSNRGIKQSMSRKGNCLDNAVMENFFGHIKAEMFYQKCYASIQELDEDITRYIIYWNNKRIKVKLNGLSPVAYRAQYQQAA